MRILRTIVLMLQAANPLYDHPIKWATWKQFWEATARKP